MALTDDEKKSILELKGRSFSERKIADRSKHAEASIRKVIRQAAERVIELEGQGLKSDRIAKQLEYPHRFVSWVLAKRQAKAGRELKPEVNADIQPGRLDIKAEWAEFTRRQELERAREKLQTQAERIKDGLQKSEDDLRAEDIIDATWQDQKESLEAELTSFVLSKIGDIGTPESLEDLRNIVAKIGESSESLINQQKSKTIQARELRHHREKERSNQLLHERIDSKSYPTYVREFIKDTFTVKNESEADIVRDAMLQASIPMTKAPELNLGEQVWQEFVRSVKEEGWKAIRRRAEDFRR